MELCFFNTLTRQKEHFQPINQNKVTMYLCGPTVYDHGHLGHGRSAVAFDVIRRYLEYCFGADRVIFVTNYTDIDDKMINRAKEKGITVKELADLIIPEYEADYQALGVKKATIQTKATDYIREMIELIQLLVDKDYAYELEDGVYFEIEKWTDYGKLSGQKQTELRAGARVESDDRKRHPHDFVLWKKEKPGEPSWDSPWGKGRPGWHIECSAMSRTNLGQPFDIHGGGMDLIFPHHEDEIAQSEAGYGSSFCNYWLHNGFITVNKEKMSKSLGNFFTLKDIFTKYSPQVVRYFFLTAHYRSPIEFSDAQLEQAKNALARLRDFFISLNYYKVQAQTAYHELEGVLKKLTVDFEQAMNDDFDTPRALALVFEFVKLINRQLATGNLPKKDISKIRDTLSEIDQVLGIFPAIEKKIDSDAEKMIKEREKARKAKNWVRSDALRTELLKKGIEVEDTPYGTVLKII
ncbi:MAG: cysteinyl-tRNA synthetase, cysteinyl-tRNA synthetase [Candidatus Peregrinibacteria bacterium GW2011_GWE2_39_6]|nr:MAG: cysteinyl-tRNA synthetase, cysteinyl-tRNA synthetase [Candidatus Peregrinibacteria bacterium GW2011_GWF2_39_17]KKR25485.1 MAG: cysteinyl-tRNA synthetase, cysteinyl-tRNA synthetase [Candidatus Peregrinibacteria bacterium GW2011_GWE2_39_6]HCW32472.1 cysteine--tRNA ligase [Candidatus Peregrinibacteria bacterium]